jgi:hypothetical protein
MGKIVRTRAGVGAGAGRKWTGSATLAPVPVYPANLPHLPP